MAGFEGFPRETLHFLEGLKANNTKEWFEAHRKDYEDYVKGPSGAFVVVMGAKLKAISPAIKAIPKVNQSLFRVNRDTRFSADKSPYKTNLGIWFWEGEKKRMECPGFYFHLDAGKLMLGVGMHVFSKESLNIYRDAVVDKRKGADLEKAVACVSSAGYSITGKHYKKVPRGFNASHKYAEFLLHNGLAAMKNEPIPEALLSAGIVDYAYSHFKNMAPIHAWLRMAMT